MSQSDLNASQQTSQTQREVELELALAHALMVGEKLSDWMRDHTGPADGTVEILTDWHEMHRRESGLLRTLRSSPDANET